MRTHRFIAHLLSTATLALLAASLNAQAQPSGPPPAGSAPGGMRRPPPEAIAACTGKTAGTQSSFTDRGGRSVSGACTSIDGVLAVMPADVPRGDKPTK